ncbi:hypothetical protein T11_3992 [Trichinella zimbabwensis]|uniref:Uncharacterized protein n=1 Tax=Trichinella zimbabwensis TaxID=268475 RepID=A0A0V1EU70_9BILA|nr:hypothetical protein T11_3992 [Trichinella zimbabwensis]
MRREDFEHAHQFVLIVFIIERIPYSMLLCSIRKKVNLRYLSKNQIF